MIGAFVLLILAAAVAALTLALNNAPEIPDDREEEDR